MIFTIIATLTALGILLYQRSTGALLFAAHRPRLSLEQTLDLERSYIDFSYAAGTASSPTDRLVLRAIPNVRLRNAFGIDNSFTTTDLDRHRAFLRSAARRIQGVNPGASPGFHLAPFCRDLCLRLILSKFFDIFPTFPEDADIRTITQDINSQWLTSKETLDISESTRLNDALTRVITLGRKPRPSAHEALGLILPSYETLWRVVLLTFVTISHRANVSGIDPLILQMPAHLIMGDGNDEFLPDVSQIQLRRIAKEGLRLFPSTKRVYRADHLDPTSNPPLRANIEKWHRHPAIWGGDAHIFRPDRFKELTPLQQKAYMPFGLRPHRCPAYNGFGEMVIGVLVLALGSGLGEDVVALRFHDEVLDGDKMAELPTGRDDMEEWTIEVLPKA